jgi:oxygen-independent coproporphyrinogen III oxidase
MDLIRKYNVPGPRYTSYPTVPFWNPDKPGDEQWKSAMSRSFELFDEHEGVSIYIHLPFCESLCTYCGCNTRITKNHTVEMPYIEAVLKEWDLVRATFPEPPILRELHLGGGTPTFFSAENLGYLINKILQTCRVHTEHSFGFEGHPANTTAEHLQVLHGLGFRRVSFGVQDYDPQVQWMIHRFQTPQQVKHITQVARSIGYTSVNYDLVYGLPLQTVASVKRTVEEVLDCRPDRMAFYSYAHVPWMKPGQRRFSESDLPDDEAKRALYEAGRILFEKAGYEEIGMDHFALPGDSLSLAARHGKLHRNFMGYTDFPTHLLIGLGVSAISDAWLAFVQNEKTVEGYMERVARNEWPFFRGHVLSDEDLLIRTMILDLMCRFETRWEEDEELHESVYEALERLAPMEDDGLVERLANGVRIPLKGRPFVRNVCMAFDARLWRVATEKVIFSKTV